MSRIEIKRLAKEQLGNQIFENKWLMALIVCLIITAINSAATTLSLGLAIIVISGPLTYAESYMFLKQSRDGQPLNIADIIKGFRDDFSQTFLIGLMTSIFTFLWAMLFVIPGIVKGISYSMAYYVKVDNPDYDWRQCIEASKNMMQGHKGEFFVLQLSFIGWYIVGALCLGVGTLWVVPYNQVANVKFYEAIKPATVFNDDSYYQPENNQF